MNIKMWGAILIIFFLTPQMILAVSPTSRKMIQEAQEYGIKNALKPINEFFKPWISYEEKAEIINENTEHSCFYTPYLLLASDVREKVLNKQTAKIAADESILKDYDGYFVFSAVLIGDKPGFADNAKAILKQEKLSVNSYQVIVSSVEKYDADPKKNLYKANIYLYFENKNFSQQKPVFLNIKLKNKQERRFYFDLPKIK